MSILIWLRYIIINCVILIVDTIYYISFYFQSSQFLPYPPSVQWFLSWQDTPTNIWQSKIYTTFINLIDSWHPHTVKYSIARKVNNIVQILYIFYTCHTSYLYYCPFSIFWSSFRENLVSISFPGWVNKINKSR